MKYSSWLSLPVLMVILISSSCKKDPISDVDDLNITTVIDCNETTFPLIWKKKNGLEVDYIVKCELYIPDGKTLVIEPGVRVRFEGSDASINSGDGGLKMIGTASLPIILEGVIPVKGSWKGVFISSNNLDNQLEYVTIRHAGSRNSFWLSVPCGLGFEVPTSGQVRVNISNCRIEQNDGYGIASWGDELRFDKFENNIFRNNTLAPVLLPASVIDKIDVSNMYENNGQNYIAIFSRGSTYTPDKDIVIPAAAIPYRFKDDLWPTRNVSINAGAILEFESGAGIYVHGDNSSISAVGTESKPIIFRGILPSVRGQWRGIYISTGSPLNLLENCQISGGGESYYWTYDANIEIFYGSRVRINKCMISDSGGYGITYSSDSPNVVLTGNVYNNNENLDVLIH